MLMQPGFWRYGRLAEQWVLASLFGSGTALSVLGAARAAFASGAAFEPTQPPPPKQAASCTAPPSGMPSHRQFEIDNTSSSLQIRVLLKTSYTILRFGGPDVWESADMALMTDEMNPHRPSGKGLGAFGGFLVHLPQQRTQIGLTAFSVALEGGGGVRRFPSWTL